MLERVADDYDDDSNINANTNSNRRQKHLLENNLRPGGFHVIRKVIMRNSQCLHLTHDFVFHYSDWSQETNTKANCPSFDDIYKKKHPPTHSHLFLYVSPFHSIHWRNTHTSPSTICSHFKWKTLSDFKWKPTLPPFAIQKGKQGSHIHLT